MGRTCGENEMMSYNIGGHAIKINNMHVATHAGASIRPFEAVATHAGTSGSWRVRCVAKPVELAAGKVELAAATDVEQEGAAEGKTLTLAGRDGCGFVLKELARFPSEVVQRLAIGPIESA